MIETYDYDSDVICVITSESSLNDWVLDSKCCFYICATKGLFDSYNPCNDGDVIMANGSRIKVIGKGKVKMKMYN